ncbi:hypothetical protein [Streptomyces spongiae]|uniref:hypothetical protein n=1 Tax=Streptomyces spongiae TaxID=565072 RepID=UPI00188365E8|nr:hypothetical protein [Streptomyces spongiae]
MTHDTGTPGTRDRAPRQDDDEREREPRDMPELHGTREEPRRSYDDRDADIRDGYR